MPTEVDFRVQDEGTIVVLYPQSDAAGEWIEENLAKPLTWWAGGVVLDHRCVAPIAEALADGWVVVTS